MLFKIAKVNAEGVDEKVAYVQAATLGQAVSKMKELEVAELPDLFTTPSDNLVVNTLPGMEVDGHLAKKGDVEEVQVYKVLCNGSDYFVGIKEEAEFKTILANSEVTYVEALKVKGVLVG